MIEHHKGYENRVDYAQLKYELYEAFGFEFKGVSKIRAILQTAFENSDETLLSATTTIYVAKNRDEIVKSADRLKRQAMGLLYKYSKLMKMPLDNQLLIDIETENIMEVKR